MAQETQAAAKAIGSARQQPSPQQQPLLPDSPYYDKSSVTADTPVGARWLLEHGWKCLGDPAWESSGWLPPWAQEKETSRLEEKMGFVRRVTGRDPKGEPIVESVREQLKQQDTANAMNMGQPVEPISQLVVTPPTALMSFRDAFSLQRDVIAAAAKKE